MAGRVNVSHLWRSRICLSIYLGFGALSPLFIASFIGGASTQFQRTTYRRFTGASYYCCLGPAIPPRKLQRFVGREGEGIVGAELGRPIESGGGSRTTGQTGAAQWRRRRRRRRGERDSLLCPWLDAQAHCVPLCVPGGEGEWSTASRRATLGCIDRPGGRASVRGIAGGVGTGSGRWKATVGGARRLPFWLCSMAGLVCRRRASVACFGLSFTRLPYRDAAHIHP